MVCVSIWPQLTVYNNVSIWWRVYQFDLSWLCIRLLYDGVYINLTLVDCDRNVSIWWCVYQFDLSWLCTTMFLLMVCISIWPQLTVYNNVSIWWCVYQFDLSWLCTTKFLYDGVYINLTSVDCLYMMVCISIWPLLTVYNNVSIWWCVYQFDLSWLCTIMFLYDGVYINLTSVDCLYMMVCISIWPQLTVYNNVSIWWCVYQFDLSWLFRYDGVYINLTSVDCVQQCFYMMVCISIWPQLTVYNVSI
jgi:hypothetical protein